jgi:hypothetical protein
MISVTADTDRNLVIAKVVGFLSAGDIADYLRQKADAVARLGQGAGEYLLLFDTSEAVIQSQDIVSAFQDLVATDPLRARRIAVAFDGSLTRRQAERVLETRDTASVFATRQEAEAWLLAA